MKHLVIKLPDRIVHSLKENYPGYSLVNIKEDTDENGHVFFIIDLLHDGNYCHLILNDIGKLIHEEVESQFANGYHEQYY